MKWKSMYDECPMCGAKKDWVIAYRKVWGEVRIDCHKCGFVIRGEPNIQQMRYLEIMEGETKKEREEIAYRT